MSKRWPKWVPPLPGTLSRNALLAWYEAAKEAEYEYWRKVRDRADAIPRWEPFV